MRNNELSCRADLVGAAYLTYEVVQRGEVSYLEILDGDDADLRLSAAIPVGATAKRVSDVPIELPRSAAPLSPQAYIQHVGGVTIE